MFTFTYQDEQNLIPENEQNAYMEAHQNVLEEAKTSPRAVGDMLDWLNPEKWGSDERLVFLKEKAEEVREKADAFVLIGVGGSNNAARAVIKALDTGTGPEIYYAGNTISPYEMDRLLEKLRGKSVYINVIAKNFETLEPGIGFRVLRKFLQEQYGETAADRIIVTGTPDSYLEKLSQQMGYTFLIFPPEIGGRYSAICDVGLFPMAVAGVDIRRLVCGAKDMRKELLAADGRENLAFRYGTMRNLLYQKGMRMEMLSFFEPRFHYFAKWWIQLFAESEGKERKGLYPVASQYSEDLHSIGQFVQEGTPIIFETFLDVKNQDASCVLKKDEVADHFDYINDVDLWDINKTAMEATFKAHSQRLPCLRITVDNIDAYSFGQLFYFFEFACYISGTLMGINPFDQPGVEAYKGYMFESLGK